MTSVLFAGPPLEEQPTRIPGFEALSSEMLAAVLDQSIDCIKLIDLKGRVSFMNRNGRCAMEIDDFSLVAGTEWSAFWPGESADLIRDAVARARNGENLKLEAFCPTAKGSPRWWDVSVTPLRDADGVVKGMISVSRDITAQVAERELRETTTAEMRHRLHNAYSLAGALVNSAARGDPRLRNFAGEVLERLSRLGAAQRLLLEAGDAGTVDLRALLERLMLPFGSAACTIDVGKVPELTINEEDVRTLALVFGELCTNSNKYGAMGFGGGLLLAGTVVERTLRLRWTETLITARQPSSGDGSSGSGHHLVSRALAARGGAMTVLWVGNVLEVDVRLPIRG